ncbi:uncharacterized protein LOC131525800 [Onychostoma macrolepis]|uniref:Immunoglobulin domain-containing protein n=1 Tax=Onychostoma macrolepis TaxID=369639 RepID=A0A7J6C173_9TELE|nr:uncharacterized protein LOC131525800 [Onychostoma macrolepis]KAF4100997.1 hypothetical protein G5714_019193 [Onychostoma macrolepis]
MLEVFTPFTMFNRINLLLLLLLCLVYQSGNTPKSLTEEKGGNATLTCEFEARKYFKIELTSKSENIPVCQEKNCSGRVFKQEACDVIIKDLKLNDSGKYLLRAYYYNDQSEVKHKERTYQLQIRDETTVKIGEELKLHVLFSNADKVEKNSSGKWSEVWNTSHGVQSERMNVSDGNLIINGFTAHDAGTYRVLDAKGDILITVTVTETNKETNTERDTDGQHKHRIVYVLVSLGILVLVLAVMIGVVIWRRRNRRYIQAPVQENPEPPQVLGNL